MCSIWKSRRCRCRWKPPSNNRATIVAALIDVENALAIRHLDEARGFQLEDIAQSKRAFGVIRASR
jgi:hypothetical protein